MALQNKTDYILLNSSNKSENALGLCTLYGDTAGAFSPTGDLYKSEMYDVARYFLWLPDGFLAVVVRLLGGCPSDGSPALSGCPAVFRHGTV